MAKANYIYHQTAGAPIKAWTKGVAMQGIASHAGRRPSPGRKPLGNRRSGRAGEPAAGEPAAGESAAGEPAAGESVGASKSLADVPQDPRLPSYPADHPRDLYESLIRTFGIRDRAPHG